MRPRSPSGPRLPPAGSPGAVPPRATAALRSTGPALCALGLVASGCVTTRGILEERGTGVTRCYAIEYQELWSAAQDALQMHGLVLERANRENGFLAARTYEPEVEPPEEMALESDAGERVAVFIERDSPGVWAVEVVSRPIFGLDVTARNWTRPVFVSLEDLLPETAMDPDDDLAACVRVRTGRPPG